QDGTGPDGRGGREAAGAWAGRAAGRGCVDHADAYVGQHECTKHHDRREGVADGAGGGGGVGDPSLQNRRRPSPLMTGCPHYGSISTPTSLTPQRRL